MSVPRSNSRLAERLRRGPDTSRRCLHEFYRWGKTLVEGEPDSPALQDNGTHGNRSAEWQIQKAYWADQAPTYHESHVCMGDEHFRALDEVIAQCRLHGLSTVLDVGTGTGRGTAYLSKHGLSAIGAEPVKDFVEEAARSGGVDRRHLLQASGLYLPFRDGSFDAVCATGVLHHIREPNVAVAEMTRVARRAVFISDSNRFGQGPGLERYVKIMLAKTRLLRLVERIRTRGKMYHISEGDGLFFSYSVYDSLDTLAPWASTMSLVGTDGASSASWLQPLVTAPHVLLIAMRDV